MRPLLIACLFAGIIASPAFAGEGHDAGYQWAEDNDIDDTSSCSTPSSSFNQGCEDYVEETVSSLSSDQDEEDEGEDE
ncbi:MULTISPECIES: hypothetical protein [Pseudomonas]|uniref:hypothetical protein n=1 Tax=Pseudomonas TaxID=286 RepID=UPI000812B8EE|nr:MULTISPECIES: hypothetical protein [Pseudomonas]NWE47964.1 hypothetical protein [Pseudomonas gingeri]CRM40707.1 hypothetical protein [Pseudomonas sp. 52 E 6]